MISFSHLLATVVTLAPWGALAAPRLQVDSPQVILAKQFVDLLNTPALKSGDLASSMLIPVDNATSDRFQPALQAHGFANLDALTLMSLAPIAPGSNLQKLIAHVAGFNSTTLQKRDLVADAVYPRLLTGRYKATAPSDAASKELSFNGTELAVTFDGDKFTVLRSNSEPVPAFSWTNAAKDKSYTITFTTDLTPATNLTKTSFQGTVTTISTNTTVPFTGVEASFTTNGLDDPNAFGDQTLAGIGLGLSAIAGGFFVYDYRKKAKANVAEMEKLNREAELVKANADLAKAEGLVSRSNAMAKKEAKAVQLKAAQISQKQLEKHTDLAKIVNNQLFKDMVKQAAQDGVDKGLEDLPNKQAQDEVRRLDGWNAEQGDFKDGSGKLVQEFARKFVTEKISEYLETHAEPGTKKMFDQMAWALGPKGVEAFINRQFQDHGEKFAGNEKVAPVLKGGVVEAVLQNNIQYLDVVQSTALANRATRVQESNKLTGEIKVAVKEAQIAEGKRRAMKKLGFSAEELAKLDKEIKDLQADIQEKNGELKKAQEDAKKESDKAKEAKDTIEKQRVELEKAKERTKEARGLV